MNPLKGQRSLCFFLINPLHTRKKKFELNPDAGGLCLSEIENATKVLSITSGPDAGKFIVFSVLDSDLIYDLLNLTESDTREKAIEKLKISKQLIYVCKDEDIEKGYKFIENKYKHSCGFNEYTDIDGNVSRVPMLTRIFI